MKIKSRKIAKLGLIVSLVVMLMGLFPQITLASALLNLSNTMSTVRATAPANHTIVFRTPGGVDAPTDTITLTLPAGFGMGSVGFADIDLAISAGGQSNCLAPAYTDETLAGTPGAGPWGAAVAGQIITLTAPTNATTGEIPANACVQIEIGTHATFGVTGTNRITNHATPGNYSIAIGGLFGNTGSILMPILADDTVVVTADVAQTLTFTVSDNTIGFGPLSSGAARFANGAGSGDATEVEAHNLTASTNAGGGYVISITGTTLTFGAHIITAIGSSNTPSSPGTEQFGVRANATAGTGVVSAPYAAAGFALDTSGFPDEFASAPGATVTTTFSVRYVANIATMTEAGSYTANLTYTATGRF